MVTPRVSASTESRSPSNPHWRGEEVEDDNRITDSVRTHPPNPLHSQWNNHCDFNKTTKKFLGYDSKKDKGVQKNTRRSEIRLRSSF